MYKGIPTQIIMANDITLQLKYIDTVENQNKKLNEIAWLQSHVVRAPLASLMGLIHVLKDSQLNVAEQTELCDNILNTANELDDVIRKISNHTDISEHSLKHSISYFSKTLCIFEYEISSYILNLYNVVIGKYLCARKRRLPTLEKPS